MRAIAAIAVLLVLGSVGCGLQAGRTTGAGQASPGGSASPSRSPSTPAVPVKRQVRCVHLRTTPGQRTVSLTNVDNHGSFCVLRGTGIFVFLHKSTSVAWALIQSTSAAVERRPSGVMSLARGVTGGFFEAAQAGTANLTSFEPRCPVGPRTGKAGVHSGHCPAPLRFEVTVHVLS